MLKNYLIYGIAFMVLLGLNGCDEWFDNELPPNDLVGENAIIDENSASVALNGVYSYMDPRHSGYSLTTWYIADGEVRLGFLTGNRRYTFDEDQLLPMTIENSQSYVEDPWKFAYKIINAANNVIYYVERLEDGKFGKNRKNEILAEARFMRAFSHMFLLKKYGHFWDIESKYGIVLRMEPSLLSNNSQARATVKACYESVFKDMDFAIQYGPKRYSVYRASATLAKAFKADWLMLRGGPGDYEEVVRLTDEVLASEEFALEENYADVFKLGHTSKELMFSRHLSQPTGIRENVSSLLAVFGSGEYAPTDAYLKIMTKDDNRYSATFDTINWNTSGNNYIKRIHWKKHYVESGEFPMYYMRLAQMYLLKAEALSYDEGSSIKDVLDVLNVLRGRAGNDLFEESDYITMENVRDEIFNENLREIGMENGALFYMAVRIQKDGKRKLKEFNPYYLDDNQLCFPIPSFEMQFNYAIEQNPY